MEGALDVIFTYDGFLSQRDGLQVARIAKLPLTLLVAADYPGDKHEAMDFKTEPFIWTSSPEGDPAEGKTGVTGGVANIYFSANTKKFLNYPFQWYLGNFFICFLRA